MAEGNELNRDIDWAIQQKAPPSCKHVLLVLANRADKNHRCFPSLFSLAEDTGMSRRNVIRCIQNLENLHLIDKQQRGINSTVYTLRVVTPSHHQAKNTGQRKVVTPGHQKQGQPVTTDKCSVVTGSHPGSDALSPPVVTPCHMEPPIEPKGNPKGDIPPTKKRREKTDLPMAIEITDKMRAWAHEEGITSDLQLETRKMLDHFKGNGEKKADWNATWRNWMRNSMVYNRRGNGNGNRETEHDKNNRAIKNFLDTSMAPPLFGDLPDVRSEFE